MLALTIEDSYPTKLQALLSARYTDQIAGMLLYLVSEAGAGVTGAPVSVSAVPHPRAHERAFVLAPWARADPTADPPTDRRTDPPTEQPAGLRRGAPSPCPHPPQGV